MIILAGIFVILIYFNRFDVFNIILNVVSSLSNSGLTLLNTENNLSLKEESREMKEFEYDDPYEEYLDRYEQYLNYEDRTLEKEYNAISRYEKLLKKKVLFYEHPLLYVVQYILGYRN